MGGNNDLTFLDYLKFAGIGVAVLFLIIWLGSESCGVPYTGDEIDRIKREAVETYIDEYGDLNDLRLEGYSAGYSDALMDVLDIFDGYDDLDPSLIDDVSMLFAEVED